MQFITRIKSSQCNRYTNSQSRVDRSEHFTIGFPSVQGKVLGPHFSAFSYSRKNDKYIYSTEASVEGVFGVSLQRPFAAFTFLDFTRLINSTTLYSNTHLERYY